MELLYLKSFLLGVIQGFTEFLPISSTAHLILGVNLLKIDFSDFIKSFIIIIQLASILAVIILYWKKLWQNFEYLKKIIIAFIPTAILGLVFYKIVKNFLQENLGIIALALFLGGVAIVILERKYKERGGEERDKVVDISNISYKQCFIIGLFQSLAMIPGVSRSASTILGGLSLGIGRLAIVEFSFLLAIPTMIAASSWDLIQSGFSFNYNETIFLIIGFLVSFVTAWLSIKFLINFIKKNNFLIFAWYRIFLGVVIFLFLYVL
ncbi:MAG: undecaprenyl-diphosphatase UppP [Patescibacteria group bacterium]|jgi:undecaprenyl-diphosphatase